MIVTQRRKRKEWVNSAYRILNRLRQGSATANELAALTKGAPGKGTLRVAKNIYKLRLRGHRFGIEAHNNGLTKYALVYDAEEHVPESYKAMKHLGAPEVPAPDPAHQNGDVVVKKQPWEKPAWKLREERAARTAAKQANPQETHNPQETINPQPTHNPQETADPLALRLHPDEYDYMRQADRAMGKLSPSGRRYIAQKWAGKEDA